MAEISTIRTYLEKYLQDNRLTINQFSQRSKINTGTLSSILNGIRPIGMEQLDRITVAMELPAGSLYPLYIQEYLYSAPLNWRRLGPFLQRCSELNYTALIEQALPFILDKLTYIPMLFELTEELYHAERFDAARLIYQSIADSEKLQHSERLALCQYRLFCLSLSDNQDDNLLACIQFEPYLERLEERYQLSAFNELINANGALQRWDKVAQLAEKLKTKAIIQYDHYRKTGKALSQDSRKPVLFYIFYAYLCLGNVYFERQDFEMSLYYVALYADDSWVQNPTEEEQQVICKFKEWAVGNRYMHKLLAGHIEVLDDYVDYISSRENEVFPALCEIVLAANRHGFEIDSILVRFSGYLDYKEQVGLYGNINNQVTLNRYTRLAAELAIYYFSKNNYVSGLNYLLYSLEISSQINSERGIIRCVSLYEQYREYVSAELLVKYKILMSEVHKSNEKKIGYSTVYC